MDKPELLQRPEVFCDLIEANGNLSNTSSADIENCADLLSLGICGLKMKHETLK